MNIKDHIEAGHYPKDKDGMEMVPTTSGRTVLIADVHPAGRIAGWYSDCPALTWDADGHPYSDSAITREIGRLLAPAPRKVKVKGDIIWKPHGPTVWNFDSEPRRDWQTGDIIHFETEFEEPWS